MAHEVIHHRQNWVTGIQAALSQRIGSERYELWLPSDTTWDFSDSVVSIGFTSEFACQLCRKMLGADIVHVVRQVLGDPAVQVRWQVQPQPLAHQPSSLQTSTSQSARCLPNAAQPPVTTLSTQPSKQIVAEPAAKLANLKVPRTRPAAPSAIPSVSAKAANVTDASADLWPRIVQGSSNQLAWTSVNMVAAEPGRLTPVVIHGPTGTGKSLLLAALAQRLRSARRLKRVLYLTSEQFTNEFTEGLQGRGLPMFRRRYRDVDALLLDDIHFFIGKRSTLAEARYTIDYLLRAGKQIIVTADRPLSELSALGGDLLGRLRGGLIAPVYPLDQSMRLTLLRQQVLESGIHIAGEALELLADRVCGDGRLIRGVVHRLVATASVSSRPLTVDGCWNAVADLVQAAQPIVRLSDIERAVCGMFGLQQDSLQSKCKVRTVSQPRMLAMFLARKYTSAAYKEIGDYFGSRRHSTVISAEKTVAEWLSQNVQLDGSRRWSVRDVIRHVESQLQVG
ncbi:MAG: ATP-binding protein [Pirellulaceae bacterium]|nr:ATP-binding protein [Pirellulaceae bacterium]